MKILIVGSSGFIGRKVREVLSASHDVYAADRSGTDQGDNYFINLEDVASITKVIGAVKPEVIINCAGVVDSTARVELNGVFTKNLLQAAVDSGLVFKRIVISGSAAEYGVVDASNIPVNEDVPLNAQNVYGLSKVKETSFALAYGAEHNLPVVVARIFNPIGGGMHAKFLISRIIDQINEFKQGKRRALEVSRLDAKRDYIDIKDVALGIKALIENEPQEAVYNIGSGISTSNQELVDLIIDNSDLVDRPLVEQTSPDKEPLVAIQADISRMEREFGWKPQSTLVETVKEIMNVTRR